MNNSNLIIDLEPRPDKDDNIFYIGRLRAPVTIDLSQGVTFLVFLSESGDEELQIAVNDKETNTFSRCTKKRDRLEIKLEDRADSNKQRFYIAKLLMNAYIRCHEEVVFLVFTSREGSEELQIVAKDNFVADQTRPTMQDIEVIRKRPKKFIND